MALPVKKADLLTMDYTLNGMPWCSIFVSDADAQTVGSMDFTLNGMPFCPFFDSSTVPPITNTKAWFYAFK